MEVSGLGSVDARIGLYGGVVADHLHSGVTHVGLLPLLLLLLLVVVVVLLLVLLLLLQQTLPWHDTGI